MKVLGFAGRSGSGKTTLMEALIPRFVLAGLRVSVIKHVHHEFDMEQPGKDSYRHRQAGAGEVMIVAPHRWALLHELRDAPQPTLREQLERLSPCDLALVEGFKREPIPKLEVHRKATGGPLLCREDPNIIALAADEPWDVSLPQFPLDDHRCIVGFVMDWLCLAPIRRQ